MDFKDFVESPLHAGSKVKVLKQLVTILEIVLCAHDVFKIFNESTLVPIASEE